MRALALVGVSLLLVSCGGGGGGGGDSTSDEDPSVWHLRSINLIDDAPAVRFFVDDTAVALANYGAASDYEPAHTGERPVKVAIRNPGKLETDDPGYTDIGDEETYDFEGPTNYTLVSAGTVAAPQQFLITDTSRADVGDNKVEYQVINAATGSGTLSVYITAPGAGIDSPQAVDTLAVGEASDKKELTLEAASGAEDDATRSSTVAFEVHSGSTVLFRSATVTLAEQTRVLIAVANNSGPVGSAPVKLLLWGGIAAADATVLNNTRDPAEVRLANTSPDSGPVDLIAGDDAGDVRASGIGYGAASAYFPLEAKLYNFVGTPTGNPGVFLFVNAAAVSAARSYTIYAQGPLSAMRGLLFGDDRRSVPTEAHFRFLYASAVGGADPVSVYLTKRGAELDLEAETPPTAALGTLAFRGISASLTLDAGAYDVYFTLVGSTDVLVGPLPLDLVDGSVQTLALADNPGGDPELVAFDDSRE